MRTALLIVLLAGCSAPEVSYVGSDSCAGCHSAAYEAWLGSDHMRAMQLPTSSSVLADFENTGFDHFGDSYGFVKEDSSFFVVTGQDTLQVAFTFGHDPLQQFLLPTHGGRYQALTVAWDTGAEQWFSLYPDEPTPPGDPLHWSSANLNWNYMCADCHSTGLRRGYNLESDSYDTTWEELSVGCEACHGPGSAHVENPEDEAYVLPTRTPVIPGVGRASLDELNAEIDMCARCHSRRVPLTRSFVHGESFLDQYAPSLIEDSLYFADGSIREEVYVYGSFMQSKMAQKGVTCSDCHDPHSGRLRREGNALCAQCHSRESYDTGVHSESGAQCVTCHMPDRTYMGVDPRRDHRFGAASSSVAAAVLALGVRSADALDMVRVALADSAVSAIQRGSLLARLRNYPEAESIRMVMLGLVADEPHERVGALRALAGWAGLVPPPDLSAVLNDSLRWIRTEAAATALAFGVVGPGAQRALNDFRVAQHAVAERPEAHLNLARMHESLREYNAASDEFGIAIRLDSMNGSIWLETALFEGRMAVRESENSLQWRNRAESTFILATQRAGADRSESLYLFGLFLAEDQSRLPDAALALAESARLDPVHARKSYNAALALQQMGEVRRAEELLMQAINNQSGDAVDALVILYMQTGRWNEALEMNAQLMLNEPEKDDLMERDKYILSRMSELSLPSEK